MVHENHFTSFSCVLARHTVLCIPSKTGQDPKFCYLKKNTEMYKMYA